MWKETSVFLEDLERLCQAAYIPWELLRGKTLLVTGATGLIGSTLVSGLLYAGEKKKLDLTVVALVRDEEKARRRFSGPLEAGMPLQFAVGTVEHLPQIEQPIDYIIHGASPTASRWFAEHPVETIQTAVTGTMQMLELARRKQVKGFVYLSSMEVYGFPARGSRVAEGAAGSLDAAKPRNSYPISKHMCESLCCSYGAEYGVPTRIVRLTQTFGPGVQYDDGRIFAEFARCVIEKKDITLKTKGETERSYLYTADAASAILTVLLVGGAGMVYNAANEGTYCSIAEMAQLVSQWGEIGVCFQIQDAAAFGYAPTLYMDLDTNRLQGLGWHAATDLCQMYSRMIADMQERKTYE